MKIHIHRSGAAIIAALLLASCAERAPYGQPSAGNTPPVPFSPPPAPDYEALWHLRVGLNVAALMCSGGRRVPVHDEYGELLRLHRDMLAISYDYEVRRYGQDGNDRHQTQLYNRFSNQPDPARYCRTAKRIAGEAMRMKSLDLSQSAPQLLDELAGGAVVASAR